MTRGDKILIIFSIFFSILSMFLIKRIESNYDEKYLSIQIDGEELKKINFENEDVGKTIPIKTKLGYNLIEIGDKKVRVIEADCQDKLDVKKGWIEDVGDSIICLPNKLIIEIKGKNKDDVDYLSR